MTLSFPWDPTPEPQPTLPSLDLPVPPKRRGRRPVAARVKTAALPWLYHHLTISGPAADVDGFAAQARGAGIVAWRLDSGVIEEDIFNLAASQPAAQRSLSVDGCRILARQFRDRVEARQARAAARVGHSRACPFDLQTLLPIPGDILQLGPTHPTALAWLETHWGIADSPRQVVARPDARPGRRLPAGHIVLGYGFFTGGDTPNAAIATLRKRWPGLRFVLTPCPAD
jgi:hypothetical protein